MGVEAAVAEGSLEVEVLGVSGAVLGSERLVMARSSEGLLLLLLTTL